VSVKPSLGVQISTLAKRSISRTVRQPVILVPNLIFPLFMLEVMSGAGGQVTKVPNFPTTSYVTFVLGAMMIQAAVGANTIAGIALGQDVETGFLRRIALTPVQGMALVAAGLAGVAVLGSMQTTLVLGVGLLEGAHVEAGALGGVAVVVVVLLVILAFGAVGQFIALATGGEEAVHSLFSLFLGLIFLSSMAMPRNLMTTDWFQTVATINPISYLIEAPRSLFVDGWDAQALALGCGIAAVILIFAVVASTRVLRSKAFRG
jgi:ABC-2 type transport system permease protein